MGSLCHVTEMAEVETECEAEEETDETGDYLSNTESAETTNGIRPCEETKAAN